MMAIGKMMKGQGMRGLLDYLLSISDSEGKIRSDCAVIGGTIQGETSREISRQYAHWRQLKPDLKNCVVHEAIRLPEGEGLDAATWEKLADDWCWKMGFCFYTTIMHEPGHIHIAALRIGADGKAISDSHDFRRSEIIIRELETRYNLTPTPPSHLVAPEKAATHKKAPTRGQLQMHKWTDEAPPALKLQRILDKILSKPVTASDFVELLEGQGIGVRANIASTGKMNGFSYDLDGIVITAKALGKGYTWANLEKKGLSYEPGRDAERLRRTQLGEALRADVAHERQLAENRAGGNQPAGADGADQRRLDAIGRGDGRPAQPVDQGHSQVRDELGGDAGQPENRLEAGGNGGGLGRQTSGSAPGQPEENGEDPADAKAPDHSPDSSPGAGAGAGGSSSAGFVRGLVEQQLEALPDDAYEVTLMRRDQETQTQKRTFDKEQFLKAVGWLRLQNFTREVVFRPTNARYFMLDDLTRTGLKHLENRGWNPALVNETSKDNFQAWFKLVRAVPDAVRMKIMKLMQADLAKIGGGGDPAALTNKRGGKLAGFTNRKSKHEFLKAGKVLAPFVKLIAAGGAVMRRSEELIAYAERLVADEQRQVTRPAPTIHQALGSSDLEAMWQVSREVEIERRKQMGKPVDESEIDFAITRRALQQGFNPAEVRKHLEGLSERKSDPADYAERTVRAAEGGRERSDKPTGPKPDEPPLPSPGP